MSELMADAAINKDWLEWYGDAWRVYEDYQRQKIALEKRISSISSVDLSKTKVINGASSHLSEEERFVLKLEKINTLIKECEEILLPAKDRLKQHIFRIKTAQYRKILILRYVERWQWKDIIEECFWYEDDFDKSDITKYKDKVMQWNRSALKKLEEISEKAFIPVEKQLTIEGCNK